MLRNIIKFVPLASLFPVANASGNGTGPATAKNLKVNAGSGWVWSKTRTNGNPASISVGSKGVHTLNLWMREDGITIDKIVLTTDSNYTPSGTDPLKARDRLTNHEHDSFGCGCRVTELSNHNPGTA